MGIICLPKRRWWGAGRESKPTVDERQLINQSINQLGGEAISQRRSIRDRATPGEVRIFRGVFSSRLISLLLLSRDSLLSFIRLRFDLSIRPKTTAAIFSRFDRCSVFAGVLHLDS